MVGVIGVISLPGRFLLPALGDRIPPRLLITLVLGLMVLAGLLLVGAKEWWRVYLYIGIFGATFGAVLPMRAVVMSQFFSGPLYGRLMGLQQAMLALAMAGGPFAAGMLRDATGVYTASWIGAAAALVAAIPIILAVRTAEAS